MKGNMMKTLTDEQAAVVVAFMDAFDLVSGDWCNVEEQMIEMGWENPEDDIEAARTALTS